MTFGRNADMIKEQREKDKKKIKELSRTKLGTRSRFQVISKTKRTFNFEQSHIFEYYFVFDSTSSHQKVRCRCMDIPVWERGHDITMQEGENLTLLAYDVTLENRN